MTAKQQRMAGGVLAACLLFADLSMAGCMTAHPVADRPSHWAVAAGQSHIHNLYRVTDTLWRSAAEGLNADDLQTLGVRTVVNLRRKRDPQMLADRNGVVRLRHIPIDTWDIKDADILAVLRIATDPTQQPVLVHCQHGADRTGLMIAAYRVVVQGWSKADAEREMIRGGYGYHPVWINLRRRLRVLDVDAMRSELQMQRMY